jgi:hypothetical protein
LFGGHACGGGRNRYRSSNSLFLNDKRTRHSNERTNKKRT